MNTNAPAYPSNTQHRSNYFYQPTVLFDYNREYNNCSNTLCYTYSKNNMYKPHSGYGSVGRTSAGYIASRRKL